MSSDNLDVAQELRRQNIKLSDLDRCEHGRHSIDDCLDCPGGRSAGNTYLKNGQRIGTDHGGNPIIVTTKRPHRRDANRKWPWEDSDGAQVREADVGQQERSGTD